VKSEADPGMSVRQWREMLSDWIELCEEPGGVAVRAEELDDGFEVDGALLRVDGGANRSIVCGILQERRCLWDPRRRRRSLAC